MYLRLPSGEQKNTKQAGFFFKCSEPEKISLCTSDCLPGNKKTKTSWFILEVLRTRENIAVYLKLGSSEISQQQGFRSTRLNPTCFGIVVYLRLGSAEISKHDQNRSTRLNPTCVERSAPNALFFQRKNFNTVAFCGWETKNSRKNARAPGTGRPRGLDEFARQ